MINIDQVQPLKSRGGYHRFNILLISASPSASGTQWLLVVACMSAVQNQTKRSTPSWPSLYDPLIEFHKLEHHAPIQPGGRYLTHGVGMLCSPFHVRLT
jgi:hypothetical protein